MAALLLLNLLVHFVPFARPGFQPDDFTFLHLARVDPPWSFVDVSLSRATRPLGILLLVLLPKVFGLTEVNQLAILIVTTSVLAALVYLLLKDILPEPSAILATVGFIVWPVKHEMYASQLFGINNAATALVVIAALLHRRWTRTGHLRWLALAATSYGLSLFIYELGFLAPLVLLIEWPRKPQWRSLAAYGLPVGLYLILRFVHTDARSVGGGLYLIHPETLLANFFTSLPSNLIGFQVARNIGYGLWAIWCAPLWFKLWCAATATVTVWWTAHLRAQERARVETPTPALGGLMVALACAALLAAPAAANLVESRHSALAAIAMGALVSMGVTRLKPRIGAAMILLLLLSTQGLAFRQAEVSALQATVRDVVREHRSEIRAASSVVFDIKSLADRIPYTWGSRARNVLRGYWGMLAFTTGGLKHLVEDAIFSDERSPMPEVRACAGLMVLSDATLFCEVDHSMTQPFAVPRKGTVILDFKTTPLPAF